MLDGFPGYLHGVYLSMGPKLGTVSPEHVQGAFSWESLPNDLFKMMIPFQDQ